MVWSPRVYRGVQVETQRKHNISLNEQEREQTEVLAGDLEWMLDDMESTGRVEKLKSKLEWRKGNGLQDISILIRAELNTLLVEHQEAIIHVSQMTHKSLWLIVYESLFITHRSL